MAPISSAVATKQASTSPYQLDSDQTLRATKALVRKIQADEPTSTTAAKTSLLADADTQDASDAVPVWLVLTTKKHISDKQRLKPGKILLPHPYHTLSPSEPADESSLRICLITADPQRKYKDALVHPSFPPALASHIPRVLGLEKLKAKYHSFESKRQLLSEYDLFLADDRVITYLPGLLGKTFYKSGAKRPIPISLEGKRASVDETGAKRRKLSEGGSKVAKSELSPQDLAREITKAVGSALVHLAPSTTTSVKVGTASQTPAQLQANTETVVAALVDKYVPQKWRNVRAIHLKGPNTAALPVWMTSELWAEETEVLDQAAAAPAKKRKRDVLALEAKPDVVEVPGPDGKMRRLERPEKAAKRESAELDQPVLSGETKKQAKKQKKSVAAESVDDEARAAEKADKLARKEALKVQKQATRADAAAEESAAVGATARGEEKAKSRKLRMKAADLM